MGWRDLIEEQEGQAALVLPWLGGRSLHHRGRVWKLVGPLPDEHSWREFETRGRNARLLALAEANPSALQDLQEGYLVGNRFVPDSASSFSERERGFSWLRRFGQVFLVEPGLPRFSRIQVGRTFAGGPYVYLGMAFPLGPEAEVLRVFEDRKDSLVGVKEVVPALHAAFDLESLQRRRAEERREQLRIEEERRQEERRQEELRREMEEMGGTGEKRRELAKIDFQTAAALALEVGGAELLDVRDGQPGEKVVRYRIGGRRLECVCDRELRIIDAGVCLTDEATGEKGDTYFTLESLPSVISQAEREGVLVVYRHA